MYKGRLLLINPFQTYNKDLESEYQSYIPYGIACIGSIGEICGFKTKVLDCLEDETKTEIGDKIRFGKTAEEVIQCVKEFKPDIVGISSTFSMFERDATEVAKIVKNIDNNITVILGGVTATLPEIYMPLLELDVYDIMSRGEGETTFKDLLDNYNPNLRKIENLNTIDGIAYKSSNKIIVTPSRKPIEDLSSLPYPALDLLNIDKILNNKYYSRWRNNPAGKKSMPIFTSRGCPYNCVFCSVHSQVGYRFRTYSINYVINLMKKCINNYGINHFHFEDDNLTLNKVRAKELFKEIKKLNITWDTPNGVRADMLDEEMIILMKESGLTSLSIAAESGNEDVRMNIIHKNLTTKSIVNAVKLCDKHDLPCIVFFVLGFPGETMKEIKDSVAFAKKLTDNYSTINMIYIANPLPGTELSKVSKEKGYIKKELTNADYFTAIRANQNPVIETEHFSKNQIFTMISEELDVSKYSVHNIALPMFWAKTETAYDRAKRTFPKSRDKDIVWQWKG